MKKVNLKEFGYYADIAKRQLVKCDIRREIANLLYTKVQGIVAHNLAFSIYRSDGEIEIADDEAEILLRVFEHFMTGAFIDGLMEQLNPKKEE